MEAVALIVAICLLFTLLAAVDEGIEKARDSRAWGAVVLAAILLDEARSRFHDWRTSRNVVRSVGRYQW